MIMLLALHLILYRYNNIEKDNEYNLDDEDNF